MRKTCVMCPTEFEAKRASAKYCSEKCKKRAQRQPGGVKTAKVLELSAEAASEPAPSVGGSVTAATAVELTQAGRLETALGQAALALARRIDHGATETGSGFASLTRQHRETLAEAVKGANVVADPLDELRTKVELKLVRGG